MRSVSDSFFVDANVLVYAALKDDSRHDVAKALLKDSSRGTICISPQILTEFYSTITSSKRVTVPYAPMDAVKFIETLLGYEHIRVLPISREVSDRLHALLKTYGVKGPLVFDLQIVATMLVHGVTKILTYNVRDFDKIAGLEVVEPN
jgi:predicted nucleic acid-binding protein